MATILLIWNPTKWPWDSLQDDIRTLQTQGQLLDAWSTGVTKRIRRGDRVFLAKLL